MTGARQSEKTYGSWLIMPEEIAVNCMYGPELRYTHLIDALRRFGYIDGEFNEKRPFSIKAIGFDPKIAVSDHWKDMAFPDELIRDYERLGISKEEMTLRLVSEDVKWIKSHLDVSFNARGTNKKSLENLKKSPRRKGKKGKKGNI